MRCQTRNVDEIKLRVLSRALQSRCNVALKIRDHFDLVGITSTVFHARRVFCSLCNALPTAQRLENAKEYL